MQITRITLRQFRSYKEASFSFNPGLNVIVGNNATGKTNILEALFFLSTLHTYRTRNYRELIQHGCQGMSLEATTGGSEQYKIKIKLYANGRKEIWLDGQRCLKQREVLGRIPVVWFSPDDLRLVKGEPEGRRRWINFIISQTAPEYSDALKKYHKVIVERNAALRQIQEGKAPEDLLAAWDEQLARYGVTLIEHRDRMIKEVAPTARRLHRSLSSGSEDLEISYQPSIDIQGHAQPESYFRSVLRQHYPVERILCSTMSGPHRDEMVCCINGTKVRSFGSQGQQRSAVLSLKLAEINYIKSKLNVHPIGLFDDVLSELDDARSQKFWEILKQENPGVSGKNSLGMQCIITAVKLPEFVSKESSPCWISTPEKQ